jgi:KUP system potassium uptake protein
VRGRTDRASRPLASPELDPKRTTFFATREPLTARRDHGMALWRDKLYLFLLRKCHDGDGVLRNPGDRLVCLGVHVAI